MAKNVNRVDHVVAKVRPENFDKTVAQLSWALGTAFYGPTDRPEAGIRCAVSWDAGIEVITPLNSDGADITEGWVSVVYGVRDLKATFERLKTGGYEPQLVHDGISGIEPWVDRFERLDEARFDPALFGGLRVTLCQVEEHPDQRTAGPSHKNVNRVDHVVAKVRPENFDKTVAQLSWALGTAFYGPTDRPEAGFRVAVSWDAGIEVITPLNSDGADITEGWVSVVYGVRDLKATFGRLKTGGYEPQLVHDGISGIEPWVDRFERLDEARFDPALFGGLRVTLCEVEEHPDQYRAG